MAAEMPFYAEISTMKPSAPGLAVECASAIGFIGPGMAADVWDKNDAHLGTWVVADAVCLEESDLSKWSIVLRSAGISELRTASRLTREVSLALPEVRVEGGAFTMGINTLWEHEVRVEGFIAGVFPVLSRAQRLFRVQSGAGPLDRGQSAAPSIRPPNPVGVSGGEEDFEEGAFTGDPAVGRGRYEGGGIRDFPASNLCWYDAVALCNWFSRRAGLNQAYAIHKDIRDTCNKCSSDRAKWLVEWDREADGYRLPTETEWEFAARGGVMSKGFRFSGSDDAAMVAALGNKRPVGSYTPNELGLFDMSGNVWEWCWDWYGRDLPGEGPASGVMEDSNEKDSASARVPVNPQGPFSGAYRVKRGGGYNSRREKVAVTARDYSTPLARFDFIGLRLFRNAGGRPRLV